MKSNRISINKRGFSVIEMMVVIAIIGLLTVLCVGAVDIGSKTFGKTVNDVSNVLNESRAYAIANNTYVFVGVSEVDGSQTSGAIPQMAGNGRIAMYAVASTNGTRLYDANSWMTYPQPVGTTPNLIPVMPIQVLDSIHLADFSGLTTTSGNMAKRLAVSSNYSLGSSGFPTTNNYTFTYPLLGGTPQYTFNKIIQFDPTGQASALPGGVYNPASTGIDTTLEVGLLPTHGNVVSPTPTNIAVGDQAAIQIDGTTGAIQIYLP